MDVLETGLTPGSATDTQIAQTDSFAPEVTTPATSEPVIDTPGANDAPATIPTPAAQAAQAQAQQAMISLTEAARQIGYDPSGFTDDRAFFTHLIQEAQRARQNSFYTQLGQQVAPHAEIVRQALAQRQQPQQQPQAPQPWNAPEWDERWLQMVDRDPATGLIVAKPGVDPSIAQKVQAAQDWVKRFTTNPMSVIEPYIQNQFGNIDQRVNQIVEQRLAQIEEQRQVQGILAQNADWLYLRGQDGRPVVDPMSGRPRVSPAGARYMQHVQRAVQLGIRNTAGQDEYARGMLAADLAAANGQQQGQTPPGANHQPNVAGARTMTEPTRQSVVPGTTPPNTAGKSLQEIMAEAMRDQGITDADFASAFGR